jgi:hypothetical protein
MSDYDRDYDDRRSHRGSSTRYRDREPEYVSETTFIQRGNGRPSDALVYRGREDSIEDIPRDFPPPNAEYRRTKVREDYPPRRPRSSRYSRDGYDDDYYSDYAPPVAAAGSRRGKKSRDDDYYSDGGYDRPPLRERRKSKVEELAEGVGLGGVLAAVTGKARSRSKSRRRRGSSSDRSEYRSRSRGGSDNRKKWQQAAKAAVVTGVIEAVRSRNEPGPWTGAKGQRIATAALAAGGVDGFLDRDPNKKSKRHIIESVVGGLAANRLANGPRERSGSRGRSQSRSRSRGGFISRSRSRLRSLSRGGSRGRDRSESPARGGRSRSRGLKDVAALGGIAAAGKAIYDRVRSKSRGRDRRSPSVSSEDSYVPARRPRYRADRGGPSDEGDIDRGRPGEAGGEGQLSRKRDVSSSSVSTTDLENQRKKTRGKELLTAGLATVATIHAAHGVYSSMVASQKRHKLVMEGEMSPEEARKRKSKNMLQDAAAVGIAALGIKSAFGEWKEMNETRHSFHELENKKRKKRKAREHARREQRNNGGGYGNQAYGYSAPYGNGPTYADANPYAANLPPPPMGAQQAPRY